MHSLLLILHLLRGLICFLLCHILGTVFYAPNPPWKIIFINKNTISCDHIPGLEQLNAMQVVFNSQVDTLLALPWNLF